MITLHERHWFTTAQAAEYAGVSVKTVRRALESGLLAASQDVPGGKWHIRRTAVDDWLSGRTAAQAS